MAAQASPSGPAIICRNSCPLAETRESKLNSGMAKQQAQQPLSSKLMKRRVHTVSAGLAYGSTGFRMDTKTRMSRFELGKETANILSTSSEGSGQSCYTKNEEWS
ncbi:hypothetical protein HJC23_004564 [Cyclotella cryptica]|uniref:Uncharacterized protein n=1 Tax=Cyclotella cryptica TaxID=29204 RepID=A0ABD3QB42_9STRA|eukprot:CCRYP_007309-RA/>CCRYP_007309-RA protein AED:0.45 eAED:0.45 QI:0/-1/0/1/-1/1/1/0/104